MKYEIEFDNNMVEKIADELRFRFEWAQNNREVGDYARSAKDVGQFEADLQMLEDLFGIETRCRIMWDDGGYPEIRTARIGEKYFVYNGEFDERKLYDALWEIAHGKKA